MAEPRKPQPSTLPIVEVFSGGENRRIGGISDHHIPSVYAGYECVVHELQAEMVSFTRMILKGSFTILGDETSVASLYEDEDWKLLRTKYVLEKNQGSNLDKPSPLFALLLNKYLQVVSASIQVESQNESEIIFDQSCELILLPNSYPPLAGLPTGEEYVYYDKKATIFYGDIVLNKKYDFEIELEANAATFEFAPVFPFGKVTFEKFSAKSDEYELEALGIKVSPTHSNNFPDWYEEAIDHKVNMGAPRWPNFRSASPFRGEVPLFNIESIVRAHGPKSKAEFEKIMRDVLLDLEHPVQLSNYDTIRFAFSVVIPLEKDFEVNVRTIQRPIPPRIYEQMQALPMYQDVLVKYDIFNFTKKTIRVRVETEIMGYTEKVMKVFTVAGMSNGRDKRCREIIFQCPRLKRDVLDLLTRPEAATMRCLVRNEDTKTDLFGETFNVDLLANDEMVWSLKDIRSNTDFDLHDFICAWITPRDKEGRIEKVRTEAAKLRPTKAFGDQPSTLGDIYSHAKAVYDYLAAEGMVYVNQPFSSVSLTTSQRVVLPEVVLSNNAGNCIDLVVLFASIMEGAGIPSLIFMPPGHAFIGWGNKNNPEEIIFLETTVIGQASFEDAVEYGKKAFDKDFTLIGAPANQMLPPFLVAQMKGCHIVDTSEARKIGKVSFRKN